MCCCFCGLRCGCWGECGWGVSWWIELVDVGFFCCELWFGVVVFV